MYELTIINVSVSDITAKNRKRKLSETKETRQVIEKFIQIFMHSLIFI